MASNKRKGVKRSSARTSSYRTGVKRRSRNEEENEQDLEQAVENYQTRLTSSGVDADSRNALEKLLNLPEDQNFLFDIAEIIGRPQQALFGAIDAAQKGEDAGEAAWKGLTGEKYTSGGQLLRNAGIGDDSKGSAKITDSSTWGVDDVLGLALDIFADPVDLALIPVTGGTSAIAKAGVNSANVATDTVKGLKGTAKLAKTADTAGDIAKAVDTASNVATGLKYASKTGEAADLAKAVTGLTDTALTYKYKVSLLDLLTRELGKGAKGAVSLADSGIGKGLSKLDNLKLNNLLKQAAEQGKPVTEAMLRSADLSSLSTSYDLLKKDIISLFDYSKSLPGNLINKARNAKGDANFARNWARTILQNTNQELDNYVYNVLKNSGVDLTDLDNYVQQTGKLDIDQFLQGLSKSDNFIDMAEDSNSLYRKLYDAKSQASLDVRDLIESRMDTSINGKTVLNNLSEKGAKGTFTGTEESVNNLARYLDANGIKYKTELNKQGLGMDLKLDRSSGNLKLFRELQQNPDAIDAFSNMNLRKSLGYTQDELSRIKQLQHNKELNTLARHTRNNYKKISNVIKQATGVDYSDIISREGYIRRAKDGTISAFNNSDFDDFMQKMGNKGNVDTKAFGTRKYAQPTLVTERLNSGDMSKVGDNLKEQGITGSKVGLNKKEITAKNIDTQIKRTQSQLSSVKKQNLIEQKQYLEERIKATASPSKTELSLNKSIDIASKKEQKIMDSIDAAKTSLNDTIIKKAQQNPDLPATKSLIKKSQAYGAADEAYNAYLKEFNKKFKKAGTYTEKEFQQALDKLDNLNQKRLNAAYDIQIASSKLAGSVDDATKATLKKTNKTFDKVDTLQKSLNETATRKELLSARKELQKSARSEMSESLTRRLKNVENQLKTLASKDNTALDKDLLNEITNLQKAKEVLTSSQGAKIFDENYISGMDNFIDYATKEAAGAKIYNEALAVGTFYDDNLVLRSADVLDKSLVPRNMIKLDPSKVTQMKAQLNSIKGILPDNSKAIDNLIKSFDGNAVYMDKNLVNLLNFGTQVDVKPILKLVNGFNNVFKRFKVFTAGFHFRNFTGNAANLTLSGIPTSKIPDLYKRAAQILDDDNIINLLNKATTGTLSKTEQQQFELLRQFVENGFYRAGTGVQDLGEIVSRTYNTTETPLTDINDLSKAVGGTTINKVANKTINRATDFSAKLNDTMDSINRMAALIYGNENPTYFKKLGFDNAADAVRYALFDPKNMSPTEINTIKKIIPFYTFTKQNILYQITNVGKNTTKYHQLIKAFDKAYDSMDEDSYRDYQKENFQLPLPFEDEDGNTIMLKMNLPVNDLTIFSSPQNTLQRIVSSTTPLIRAPFEQVTGVDTYTGQEIYRSGIEQLANYIGINSLTTDVWNKIEAIIARHNGDMNSTEMWTEIFNSLAQYNNQEKIKNSNLYEEMERYSSLVSDLKDQGIEVPTIRDLTNTSSTRLTQLQRKRNKRNNSN